MVERQFSAWSALAPRQWRLLAASIGGVGPDAETPSKVFGYVLRTRKQLQAVPILLLKSPRPCCIPWSSRASKTQDLPKFHTTAFDNSELGLMTESIVFVATGCAFAESTSRPKPWQLQFLQALSAGLNKRRPSREVVQQVVVRPCELCVCVLRLCEDQTFGGFATCFDTQTRVSVFPSMLAEPL